MRETVDLLCGNVQKPCQESEESLGGRSDFGLGDSLLSCLVDPDLASQAWDVRKKDTLERCADDISENPYGSETIFDGLIKRVRIPDEYKPLKQGFDEIRWNGKSFRAIHKNPDFRAALKSQADDPEIKKLKGKLDDAVGAANKAHLAVGNGIESDASLGEMTKLVSDAVSTGQGAVQAIVKLWKALFPETPAPQSPPPNSQDPQGSQPPGDQENGQGGEDDEGGEDPGDEDENGNEDGPGGEDPGKALVQPGSDDGMRLPDSCLEMLIGESGLRMLSFEFAERSPEKPDPLISYFIEDAQVDDLLIGCLGQILATPTAMTNCHGQAYCSLVVPPPDELCGCIGTADPAAVSAAQTELIGFAGAFDVCLAAYTVEGVTCQGGMVQLGSDAPPSSGPLPTPTYSAFAPLE